MISVLLIILKIIGIALLVILGLIFLLLLCVLLVPVRYQFSGNYDDKFHCKGKVTWLLHFLSIRIDVEEETITSIWILGIPISSFLKKKSEDMDKEDAKMKQNGASNKNRSALVKKGTSESIGREELSGKKVSDVSENSKDKIEESEMKRRREAFFQNIIDKIQAIIKKIKDFFYKIKDFIANIKEKKETINRYLTILKSDTVKAAFGLGKSKIFKMLKHISPRKMTVNITFGFDDPANTGYALAVFGMLPAYWGKKIFLHPDFEKEVFECNFKVRGAIRAWNLFYHVLSVIFNKDCQNLYYIVKKEISNE